jgi:hypothetical protein
MKTRYDWFCSRRLRIAGSVAVVLLLAWPVTAAVESGAYQVAPGATVEERGDRVPNGSRIVPLGATVEDRFGRHSPSLTAVITNAVLEGGSPFSLTVRSSSGYQLANNGYRFSGDYLRDIYPSGTQYLFDWSFSRQQTGKSCGTATSRGRADTFGTSPISNLTLVPQPLLIHLSYRQHLGQGCVVDEFPDHVLEYATNLPAVVWAKVTNPVAASVAASQLQWTWMRQRYFIGCASLEFGKRITTW